MAELARRCGTSPSVLWNAVKGDRGLGADLARRMARALGMSQVDVFRVAGLLDEPELAHNELAGLARLLARIPDSERDRIVHALEAMLEQLGASYVESSGDPDDHATDEHGRAGGSGA